MNMKFFKTTLVLILFPILISSISHKFYVSTTNVEYVPELQTIQIISKIFIEDLEQVLQERYSSLVVLNPKKETKYFLNVSASFRAKATSTSLVRDFCLLL